MSSITGFPFSLQVNLNISGELSVGSSSGGSTKATTSGRCISGELSDEDNTSALLQRRDEGGGVTVGGVTLAGSTLAGTTIVGNAMGGTIPDRAIGLFPLFYCSQKKKLNCCYLSVMN